LSSKLFSDVQININVLVGNIMELRRIFGNRSSTANGQISIVHNKNDFNVKIVGGENGTSSK